ncbi:hypothetical protein C7423_10675 [Pantoea ananatis]|jgi:hypothetical protein|nr:hypothetical protein C7426_103106 [Pantoea ananatis]REC90523.1 hypothetical protein C7423_10675 [Pantoea ananatis]
MLEIKPNQYKRQKQLIYFFLVESEGGNYKVFMSFYLMQILSVFLALFFG